jgi:hypothetical protein
MFAFQNLASLPTYGSFKFFYFVIVKTFFPAKNFICNRVWVMEKCGFSTVLMKYIFSQTFWNMNLYKIWTVKASFDLVFT